MNWKRTAIFVIVILASGIISFFNARLSALSEINQQGEPSQNLFNDVPKTVIESEENFDREIDGLFDNLETQQKSLAADMEDPCSTNEVIMEKLENVISAHEHLLRRISEHIVELRHELPEDNREELMRLCAEAVSGPMSRLGGPGRGARWIETGQDTPNGRGYGYGRQGNAGRGGGYRRRGGGQADRNGFGRRSRVMERLANRLRLSQEQIRILQDNDPNFETDAYNLYRELTAEKEKLVSIFENPQSNDDEFLQQMDNLIITHSRIERRMAEHVFILRPYLSIEQQKWLIGLCRRSETNR